MKHCLLPGTSFTLLFLVLCKVVVQLAYCVSDCSIFTRWIVHIFPETRTVFSLLVTVNLTASSYLWVDHSSPKIVWPWMSMQLNSRFISPGWLCMTSVRSTPILTSAASVPTSSTGPRLSGKTLCMMADGLQAPLLEDAWTTEVYKCLSSRKNRTL